MEYNDELLPTSEIISAMNSEYDREVKVCEVGEYRQIAELKEIYSLLDNCEEFFKWLGKTDENFTKCYDFVNRTIQDKVTTACCCRGGLDYRYCEDVMRPPCDKKPEKPRHCEDDFNDRCCDYCKCELEILDRILKLLTLKNSMADKECMIRLIKSRTDMINLIFNNYCNKD